MKKILIISVGGSPAVVTETVWSLFQRKSAWVADIIHLVTTSQGKKIFEKRGLTGESGKLDELFTAYRHSLAKLYINVPKDKNDNFIADIRTQRENILFANEITSLVKHYADYKDTQIHMSLAGGRKTQSSYAQAAMELFGRPQDELSHVLVKVENPTHLHQIEFASDFWWPGQKTNPVHYFDRQNNKEIEVSIDGVGVEMGKIPFVRLSPALVGRDRDVFMGDEIDYETIVKAVQDSLDARHLTLDISKCRLSIGNNSISMANLSFAIYALMAKSAKDYWTGAGSLGIGGNHTGWLTYEQIFTDKVSRQFLDYYTATFSGKESKKDREMVALITCCIEGYGTKSLDNPTLEVLESIDVKSAAAAEKKLRSRLESAKGRINKIISEKILNPEIRQRIQVLNLKEDGTTRFGLTIGASDIHFINE